MPSRLPRKFDPQSVEQEFVTSDISIRELARRHAVSWSTLASWARKEDWRGKRVAYKAALSRRSYEVMAADIATQTGVVKEESVAVMRATLRAYAQQLKNGEVKVNVKDAVEAVRALTLLLAEPEETKEDPTVVSVGPSGDADFFRRIVETARRRVAASEPVEGTAQTGPAITRAN